jgi:hypothetical protein
MEGFNNPYTDRLVGVPAEPEIEHQWQEKIIDTVENIGAEFIEGLEIQKTERDLEIIKYVVKACDEILKKYGREKVVEIPLNNMHVLKDGGTKEFTKGRLLKGSASITQKSFIADRAKSDIEFALTVFHELTHLKSYSALQVVNTGDGEELETYRAGVSVISRDASKIQLQALEEAVVGYLTQHFYYRYLRSAREFEDNFLVDNGRSGLSRQEEMKNMHIIIDMMFAKNKGTFSDGNQILNLLIDAQVNGNLLPIARLIEDTFGTGSLKQMDTRAR